MDRRQAPPSSEELVRQARDGDGEAFDELFRGHDERLRSLIRLRLGRRLRGSVDLEDVLQEAQLRAYTSIGALEWRSDDALYRWLAGIVRHVIEALSCYHPRTNERAGDRQAVSIDPRGEISGNGFGSPPDAIAAPPSDAPDREERLARLEAAFDQLRDDDREVILLARIERLSIKEIAATMGRSPAAVSMLLLRALRELRRTSGSTATDRPPPGRPDSRTGNDPHRSDPPSDNGGDPPR